MVNTSTAHQQPEGSYGAIYSDLVPPDATVVEYDPKRFALMTGFVHDISGQPIADVSVTIHSHPEYGTAYTDAAGQYTIPVEGGTGLQAVFNKPGLIPSQRQVEVPWNDIAIVETVRMIEQDTAATTVSFDGSPATITTHQSTEVVDEFGSRSATVVFQGDNRAYGVDEQGNITLELSTITVRATEFTAPETMPAVLPPNSAYTYCVELSVDGVKRVKFDKPVITWIDNFLGFAVGEAVPVGYFDRDRGVWIPADNGIVVRLLDTDGDNIVDALDADNDGLPDDLNANGSFTDEVIGLHDPSRYAPDTTFWRVSITHFTPWDYNWPYGPPLDATAPNPDGVPDVGQPGEDAPDDCQKTNSYIKKRNRVYHEDIPLPGIDMTLHYAGNRVKGYKTVISVPASGPTVPASLKSIIVKVDVAGRTFEQHLSPLPNQQADFLWDGFDHTGRVVRSATTAHISIGFVYQMQLLSAGDFQRSFAQAGSNFTAIRGRMEITLWQRQDIIVSAGADAGRGTIAEGWTLSAQHYLTPGSNHLFTGNGALLNYADTRIITTLAGNGFMGWIGDNGPAIEAQLAYPTSVTVDSSGNLYFADSRNNRIRKIDSSGIITTVAGTGSPNYSGDNGPAIEARLNYPYSVTVDSKDNLYIADYSNRRIRKVDSSGIITTVAGNGSPGYSGDNGPAIEAQVGAPTSVAVDSSGNLYIAERGYVWSIGHNHVRKVDSSGIITTVAGNGSRGYSGDNGPAIEAGLGYPSSVTVDSSGNLYIADSYNSRIRKVDSSGIITTVAGNGLWRVYNSDNGDNGDNGPAVEARLYSPYSVTVDSSGNLYIADSGNNRIRKVDSSGIITNVAGNGNSTWGYSGDNGLAIEARLNHPTGVAIDSSGNLYIADSMNRRIRKVYTPSVFATAMSNGDIPFADDNGLAHIMSPAGLHKSTIDLDTGVVLRAFGYDGNNNLISITDQFGSRTIINRDSGGTPLSIVSPDGITTELTIDASNHLTRVSYPDGSLYDFEYTSDGLMTAEIDPVGNRFDHYFTANGRLTDVVDQEGGHWNYQRTALANGDITLESLSAEGDLSTIVDHTFSTGAYTSTITDASGAQRVFNRSGDGLTVTDSLPCGMDRSYKYGLDPEYKFKFVKESSSTTPSGLLRTTFTDKTYQDTDLDGVPDLITDTLTVNGKIATIANDVLQSQKTLTLPTGRRVTANYDPATLLTTSLNVSGLLPTTYGYDTQGRTTSITTGTRSSGYAYNPQGVLSSLTDPENNTTSYSYDLVGRVTSITRPDTTTVNLTYDKNGNMTVLTNPSATDHLFGYNSVNNKNSYQTPFSGSYTYIYDRDRRLTQINYPSGFQLNNIYGNGLLTQTQTMEGNIDYSYLCSSKIGTITKGTDSLTYGYDGSFITSVASAGTLAESLDLAYNNDFQLSSLTYGGASESYLYDNDGLLTGAGTYTITRNVQNGLPESVYNGILSLARTFNGYGEISGETGSVGTSGTTSWSAVRDDNGRIIAKSESVNVVSSDYSYTYDTMGRLLTVSLNSTLVEEYGYDANGSRTYEMNALTGISRTYAYSTEDHLLSAGTATYVWDPDGFLLSKTQGADITAYNYSSRGELLDVTLPDLTVIEYLHDPLGRRIAKKADGVIVEKYLWADRITLLAVYDGADNLLQRFEYADTRMPLSMTMGGATYYLSYDQVGSLRTVSDATGNLLKEIVYDSFGSIINDSNPAFTVPIGFAGGLHDRDTGLVRFGYRDYDPAIGRWVAKDPIFFNGGDVDLYGYVLNDPVNFIDPLGLVNWGQVGGGIGIIATGGAVAATGGIILASVPAEIAHGPATGGLSLALVPGTIGTGTGMVGAGLWIMSLGFGELMEGLKDNPCP